ncbi:thermostable hemolysin [Motilimonas sp. KMU-193]|uniref:thermostable hemolysin n=1 Tax=Motilimonas sp. KMU-193 TaxID=3388668 RepID=UPI00396B1CF4
MEHNHPEIGHFSLHIIEPSSDLWQRVTNHVALRYKAAFAAELTSFMPAYLTLCQGEQIVCVCGFRIASNEPLFLEQYLPQEAQLLITKAFHCDVKRSHLIEFGHLASFATGMSSLHFYLMAQMLVDLGYEWCIFTATDPLHAMMRRLGLQPHLIAQAEQSKIPNATTIWGSYYEYQPKVMAGSLGKGLAQLRAIHANKIKRA